MDTLSLMEKRVLLVEDAMDMQMIVKAAIEKNCDLKCVETLSAAQTELSRNEYSLILLDVNLPDGDGFEFCQSLRRKDIYSDIPIIFLTGETETRSRVLGFELGADDYVTKPIEPQEFTARVLAKLKRPRKAQTSFSQAGYRVDLVLHKIFEKGEDGAEKALVLTPIEFKLLSHFLQNREKIFSRQDLLSMFWGDDVHVSGHTVDTHISSLRKKMGEPGRMIRSVFKKGYRLSSPVQN
jgi:two-component system, OmpR family, phosphate regulon response regulator PhoB